MSRLSNLFAIMFVGVLCASPRSRAQTAYDAVDPFIGTTGDGNTFPGASLPFGMIQWSPESGSDGWYFYDKASIRGFSLTHLSGAGCPLYGDFPILPWTGELTTSPAATPDAYTVAVRQDQEGAVLGPQPADELVRAGDHVSLADQDAVHVGHPALDCLAVMH